MTPLPLSFAKNGFHYEQILRRGNLAIYKQRLRPGVGCLAFEVIRIKQIPDTVMFKRQVPAHEAGPSNEDFGSHGWSYPTLERAKEKMRVLEEAAAIAAEADKSKETTI